MTITSSGLYPLLMERQLVQRLWGGQRIAAWLALPDPHPANLGETWEVFDTNRIRNGALAGQTLAQVTAAYGEQLIGTRPLARYGADFPLLIKFIDANDRLSIQVHPDDAYAHTHEAATGFHGKTEAWYILSADPGAEIIYGLNQSVDRATFAQLVQEGSLEQVLQRVPVRAGDMIFVPAGTLHAINEGITLFEIQEKSDLTYRVYDYGRREAATGQPRTLHIEKALDVMQMTPSPRVKQAPVPLEPDNTRLLMVACSFFALEQWLLTTERRLTTQPASFETVTLLAGAGTLSWPAGTLSLKHGDSVVLPATLGAWTLRPTTPELRMLRAYVPDLEEDIIVPLQSQGVPEARIAMILGGV